MHSRPFETHVNLFQSRRAPSARRSFARTFAGTVATLCGVAALGAGCAGRPSLFPNSDPNLRKTSAEFAADAAKRHPFKADLPPGGTAKGRAQVDYGFDVLEVANLSDEDWDNVEIWVNRNWCVFVPKIEKGTKVTKSLDFQMLFDDKGVSFPTNNVPAENQVHQLEMVRDGKLYTIKSQLAD